MLVGQNTRIKICNSIKFGSSFSIKQTKKITLESKLKNTEMSGLE